MKKTAAVFTPEQDAVLIREWPNADLSVAAVARLIGQAHKSTDYRARIVLKLGAKPSNYGWTEDRNAKFRLLWADEKISTREIAEIMKSSKGAVSERAKRLGCPSRAGTPGPKPGQSKLRAPPVARAQRQNAGLNFKIHTASPAQLTVVGAEQPPEKPPQPKTDAWAPLAGSTPVTLMQRAPFTCKWPIDLPGAEEQHSCGLASPADRYCDVHAERSARPGQSSGNVQVDASPRRRAA